MSATPRRANRYPLFIASGVVLAAIVLAVQLHTTRSIQAEARERFFEQYNRQQLILAQQAGRTIEELFDTIRRHLVLATGMLQQGDLLSTADGQADHVMQTVRSALDGTPAVELVTFDQDGTVRTMDPLDPYTMGRNFAWRPYFQWARDEGKPGQMYVSPFMRMEGGMLRGKRALMTAMGMYDPDGTFRGVVGILIDFEEVARRHILSVRMGEDGYAWLVDSNNQSILVDPKGEISGLGFQQAFLPKWPKLYELVTQALDGKPGMDWYDYLDPRGGGSVVRKLVGYAPVRIVENRLWTIGVCTPTDEVESLMGSFLRRQATSSAVTAVLIGLGAVVLLALLAAWNSTLKGEVEARTRDLTQARSRLESAFAELLTAKKLAAVGQMALGLVHEIRNPLSAIRMNVQMLRQDYPPGGFHQESFSTLEEEIMRLNRLLDGVMDFARPRPLRLATLSLRVIVERVFDLMSQLIAEEGIATKVEEAAVLSVTCDPDQIQQVVMNLVLNASEAMAENLGAKVLTVTLFRDSDIAGLRVHDTGKGLDPDAAESVFDPFFTTKAQGGGLGLAAVQSIVLRHKGTVDVESQGPGDTTFTVRLPLGGPASQEGDTA